MKVVTHQNEGVGCENSFFAKSLKRIHHRLPKSLPLDFGAVKIRSSMGKVKRLLFEWIKSVSHASLCKGTVPKFLRLIEGDRFRVRFSSDNSLEFEPVS